MSESHVADERGFAGRKHSPEARAAISRAKQGEQAADRNSAWKGDSASEWAIHKWIRKHYPPTGTCEECGEAPEPTTFMQGGKIITRSGTEYAFLRHPDPYTRDRSDYRELCRPCHWELDTSNRKESA
jgi:hypothetical protein